MDLKVSMEAILQGAFTLFLGIIAYLTKSFIGNLKMISDEWSPMKKEIDGVVSELKDSKTKLEKIYVLERDLKTLFQKLDDMKMEMRVLKKREDWLSGRILIMKTKMSSIGTKFDDENDWREDT